MGLSWRELAVSWVLVLAACAGEERNRALLSADAVSVPSPSTATTPAPGAAIERPQEVRFRIDRQVGDDATAGFEAVVRATLTDPRGWEQAGFAFAFGDDALFTIVLAEGEVVDGLCRPYDVGGRFSCQMGPVVALNAQRWRAATPTWTGDLATYRQMLVNHEVGHLLGEHHPVQQCPGTGQPAPVMAQQSTELHGCRPNPWPLAWEIDCAARRLEPLAPGYEANPVPSCGPPVPQRDSASARI